MVEKTGRRQGCESPHFATLGNVRRNVKAHSKGMIKLFPRHCHCRLHVQINLQELQECDTNLHDHHVLNHYTQRFTVAVGKTHQRLVKIHHSPYDAHDKFCNSTHEVKSFQRIPLALEDTYLFADLLFILRIRRASCLDA
jgi:hypothetical protein